MQFLGPLLLIVFGLGSGYLPDKGRPKQSWRKFNEAVV